MIERYLLRGIRLRWNAPGAVVNQIKNGSIINDPLPVQVPMIFDGIDPALGAELPHVSTLGLNKGMSIPHAWLNYVHGHTARRMVTAGDVLTGPMSGCLIAEWTDQGIRWVGHVGTVLDANAANKKVKRTLGIALPTQARGFYPHDAWSLGEVTPIMAKLQAMSKGARAKFFALVTTSGTFFSLLMFDLGNGEWCVGGCKLVPPMNAVQVRQTLLV